ncbi:MAG: hypothetical protein AUH29_09460 [Candidatus Rokubacteria bacterium 13_1_40CM_69_27]|nr:MAG: hypothetical protein AUH29_09460 [Candidatus Rokubacteria bacterium 13_1_40CM_69_27]
MTFPLESAAPSALGLDPRALERLRELIIRHIVDGRYPGAQIAIARRGRLALFTTIGDARLDPQRVVARDDTLWLLYWNTKVITACAVALLADHGALSLTDRVASYVPGFEVHGKRRITILELLTDQGGFLGAEVPPEAWNDHELLRRCVCDFALESTPTPASALAAIDALTRTDYRAFVRARATYWTAAVLIEGLTKTDYRAFIRENIIEPLGLADELFVGLPDSQQARAADLHEPSFDGARQIRRADENNAVFRRAGIPSSGGYGTARAMAAFYQMLVQGGTLAGVRLLSPRMVAYVIRDFTGDRVDNHTGMPMHRGLGPHSPGTAETIRGLGSLASARTFGDGSGGSSCCWGDPDSGVSFAYITNSRVPDPWHSTRVDLVSNLVHSAID